MNTLVEKCTNDQGPDVKFHTDVLFVCTDCCYIVAYGVDGPEVEKQDINFLSGNWIASGHGWDDESRCVECPEHVYDCVHANRESNQHWQCPGCGNVPGAFAEMCEVSNMMPLLPVTAHS